MPQSTLKKVLEGVRMLSEAELREVEGAVRERLRSSSQEADRERALRVLEESGLVREVRRSALADHPRRPPVPVKGQPLSETIIEERR